MINEQENGAHPPINQIKKKEKLQFSKEYLSVENVPGKAIVLEFWKCVERSEEDYSDLIRHFTITIILKVVESQIIPQDTG